MALSKMKRNVFFYKMPNITSLFSGWILEKIFAYQKISIKAFNTRKIFRVETSQQVRLHFTVFKLLAWHCATELPLTYIFVIKSIILKNRVVYLPVCMHYSSNQQFFQIRHFYSWNFFVKKGDDICFIMQDRAHKINEDLDLKNLSP